MASRVVLSVVWLLICLGALHAQETVVGPPRLGNLPPPQVEAPSGAYRYAKLTLVGAEKADGSEVLPLTLHLAFREQTAVQVFMLEGRYPQLAQLKATDAAITGDFQILLRGLEPTKITLDAAIKDGAVTGSFTSAGPVVGERYGMPSKGTVKGTIMDEAAMRKANALSPAASWPGFRGPAGDAQPQRGESPLVSDGPEIRQVWRSEATTGHGPGSATRSRPDRASFSELRNSPSWTLMGGGASLVMGGGAVYCTLHEGNGTLASEGLQPLDDLVAKGIADFEAKFGTTWADMERRRWKMQADDVVVAVDAETGQTRWRTVLPLRGINFTDHKSSTIGHTPVYADGKLFVIGSACRFYGLDAATGKVLWENSDGRNCAVREWYLQAKLDGKVVPKGGHGGAERSEGGAAAYADGVMVTPDFGGNLLGIDAATGKTLWNLPNGAREHVRPLFAHVGDKSVAIVSDATHPSNLLGVEVKSGKVAWTMTGSGTGKILLIDEVLYIAKDKAFAAFKLGAGDPEMQWEQPNEFSYGPLAYNGKHIFTYGYNPAQKDHVLLLIEPKSGKVAAQTPHPDALNHATPVVLGDNFMLQPDCVHSNNYMYVVSGNPPEFAITSKWEPQHHNTNTYGGADVGFIHPIAEGRLWFRCADGIYCYDLRRNNTP